MKLLTKGVVTLATSVMLILPTSASFAAESNVTPSFGKTIEHGNMYPAWVMPGKKTQYPSTGGTWEYGFWNVKYRSYYTVNKCHGSTVKSGDRTSRSADTASGKKSIAELWAVNNPGADPHYYYRVCD